MKIAILGFGREGQSVLNFLRQSKIHPHTTTNTDTSGIKRSMYSFGAGVYKNPEIFICDRNPKIRSLKLGQRIGFRTGKNYLKNLHKFDLVLRSPGIPYNLPEIQKALKKKVNISSPTKLFFELAKQKNCSVIGLTGTKGKGTTATLLYKILKDNPKLSRRVYFAGNVGKPALDLFPLKKDSVVVLELSSFQLQDLKTSPQTAIVLDIFPDHMDVHKNLKEYLNAKANIARYQSSKREDNNKVFFFTHNKYSVWIAKKSKAKKMPVKIDETKLNDFENKIKKIIRIPGEHNFKNAVMAANVALSLGCPKEKILKTIGEFTGNEHRLEFVRTINPKIITTSIAFYNDSASTNPQTAAAAIKSFDGPKILIAGGKDKNLEYSSLAEALKNSQTKLVILFGENKEKIKQTILKSEVPMEMAGNLESALESAYRAAKLYSVSSAKPVTIIFSPASASFDMFKDYEDRGKKFKELVKKLTP